jgi:hypothetical protein
MLEDIKVITTKIFDEFMDKELLSAKQAYLTYLSMQKMIGDISLVADHYLALDFSEDFLQHSSFGEPANKWRYVLNEDLQTLNKSIKEFLSHISHLSIKDEHNLILDKYYNAKSYYAFVKDEYNVGFIKPCSFEMICKTLNPNIKDNQTYCISKDKRIDLDTFDKRVNLQNHLKTQHNHLTKELDRLKQYILKHFDITDLL